MDDLEQSLKELSFDASSSSDDEFDVSHVELFQEPDATSTPVKKRPGKHPLTPESKAAAESKPKRFASYNLSSVQCNERRHKLFTELEHIVEYHEESDVYVKQSLLMALLDLSDDDKSILTRSIKGLFPNSNKKTMMIEYETIVVYTNLSVKNTHGRSHVVRKRLLAVDSNEILVLQNEINIKENSLVEEAAGVVSALDSDNTEFARELAKTYQGNLEQYLKLNSALITIYESKLRKLDGSDAEKISSSQKEQIEKEIKEMEKMCSFGMREESDVQDVLKEEIFNNLLHNFEEKCPLLHSVLQTLLVTDKRQRVYKTSEYKLTCGVNALSLLLSVRNQKCKNDVRLLLGLVCVTYGAGKQFINLLNSIGLTPHWDTINNYLDQRQEKLSKVIKDKCPETTPVILLMDNVNIYRGKKRHLRLFKSLGPKMWNFTVRGAIIPDISEIEELMTCKETATMPQTDISQVKAEDLFLDSMPEHKKIWDDWLDGYYLELLDGSLNGIPKPPKPFLEMSEVDLNSWLSKVDFGKHKRESVKKFKISLPSKQERCLNNQSKKTDVVNLPLSLEDNSTLTGTAAILEQFGKEFSIPCPHHYEIPFNKLEKKYDLKSARLQYEFMRSVDVHNTEMQEMEKQLRSYEKQIDASTYDVNDTESDTDSGGDDGTRSSGSVTKKAVQQPKDARFKALYERISNMAHDSSHSINDDALDNVIQKLSNDIELIDKTRDQYGRTIFHCAVETKNYVLVKLLLAVGVNPNAKEGCGATPMTIAVLNADLDASKILLENFAEFEGALFGSFPSPLEIATAMKLADIVELLQSYSRANDSPIVEALQRFDSSFGNNKSSQNPIEGMDDDSNPPTESDDKYEYKRSDCKGFPTAIVGDVGTCKINRGVKHRNSTAYSWMTEIPGDMHAKGHLCEATFKAHGKGGFHKVVNYVMKRPKLTEEAFKKRKFQEQNLNHIQESVRDASCAYGFAAVEEFKASDEFPSDEDLTGASRKNGNHNTILLNSFKKWLKKCAESDDSHRYHQQLFSLFGPLLDLFLTAGKEGDGTLRETAWVLLLPIFAQLNFRNYWTEAFVHVVNFTSLWPLAFRRMVKNNMSVNLSGKRGHNVDLDEYVETYIVRPLKNYTTGHTSVQMCQRLMGNLDVLGSVRRSFTEPFNYHQTTKHKEQSSLPDVVKGMWFCLTNNFFTVSSGKVAMEHPLKSATVPRKPVSQVCMGVVKKGEKKVKDKFKSKLHESFPSYRKLSLENLQETDSE